MTGYDHARELAAVTRRVQQKIDRDAEAALDRIYPERVAERAANALTVTDALRPISELVTAVSKDYMNALSLGLSSLFVQTFGSPEQQRQLRSITDRIGPR